MSSRSDHLEALLRFDRPVAEITRALKTFGWDSSEELVVLTRENVRTVLQRFIANEISALEIEEWAEAIEGRDDIGLEKGHSDLLLEVVFELANPRINGELTRESAQRWLSEFS